MKEKFTLKISSLFVIGLGLFLPSNTNAQFNESAPWIMEITKTNNKQALTIDQMVASFDKYWLTNDKDKKGSGYKPFMRWEYHWRNNAHSDGNLITPAEIWDAWKSKQKSKLTNRSTSTARVSTSNWQAVGPFTHTNTGSWSSGQGRVNVVYVDPNNANTIYIGAPAGGIWKSTNAGLNWTPLSDNLPQIGVSGIVTDPTDSNIIYIATGDKDAGDTYSIGVLKSTDGGVTWNTTGLSFSNTSTKAADIFIHPTNSTILWVATSVGLYKTTNAGVSWTAVLSGNIKDIKLKPGDPNTIYAVTTTNFYKSTDGGTTFTNITSGLPASSGRLAIGVTAANTEYVYVLSATTGNGFQGLYRSTDGGTSFTKTSSTTDIFESTQAWYDMALGVSQTNAELVFTGCLNVWKSTNGGTTFTKVSNWSSPSSATYTHADIHFLRYYGDKLYCGSDGGIYVSSDNGASFTSKTAGLQIGQLYKIAVSKQSSANMVGGLQDNGGHGYSGGQWKNYYGADGMDTGVDPNNSSKFYGFIQNGGNLYISTTGGNSLTSTIGGPASGNWVTPLAINSAGEVFAGYTKVYKLNGTSWIAGTTTFSSNVENVIVDPSDDNIMYVSDAAKLYKSTDKGVTFALLYTFPANVKDIRVHSSNGSIIYAVTQGTGGLVYKSTDGGTTFTSINTGLPSIGKTVIVHQAQDVENTLYLGTTLGVYYRDDSMSSWLPFDANLPNVPVTDLEINYVDNNLTAATYGRGVWRTPISTSTQPDITAPTAPTLVASGTTQTTTSLSWSGATDDVAVTGYDVYKDDVLLGSTASTTYPVSGLAASTTYSFTVIAKDAAGNTSASSNAVSVTTLDPFVDTTAPTPPTLTASGTTATATNLSWSGATDDVAVTGYDVYKDSVLLGSTASTTYAVSGLTASTAYIFTVIAKDAAGNTSAPSNAVTVTTTAAAAYCPSQGNSVANEKIGKVVFGTISNTTTAGTGYENYTAISTNVTRGVAYTITITPSWTSTKYREAYAAWIDYNGDGDFADAGEQVWSKTASKASPVSGTFTIPSTATVGATRMRVSMKYNGIPTPCEMFSYGQVEDYTVNIGAAPTAETTAAETELGNKYNSADFNLYPNPVENMLSVSFSDGNKATYTIYNLLGQEVKTGNLSQKEINVSHLSPGLYLLELNDGQKISTKKFVKK